MFSFINRELLRRKNTTIAEITQEMLRYKKLYELRDSELTECNSRNGYSFERRQFATLKDTVPKLEKRITELQNELLIQQERYNQLLISNTALQQTLKTRLCKIPNR